MKAEVLAVALGVIAAAYAWTARGSGSGSAVTSGRQQATGNRQQATGNGRDGAGTGNRQPGTGDREWESGGRPASLAGTETDGTLIVSEEGMFIPTPDAIRLFDYYLTTLGETDVVGVRRLVAGDARRYAPERVDDVLELFDRYVAYLDDLEDSLTVRPDLPIADLHAVTLSRQRAHFGDDADILFGEDNALASQLLARASGNGDRSSSSMKSRSLP